MENKEQVKNSVIQKIKALYGIYDTDRDSALNVLVSSCIDYALDYTSGAHVTENVIFEMALEDYAKIGSYGIKRMSKGQMSEEYTDGYSKKVMLMLNSLRKLRAI